MQPLISLDKVSKSFKKKEVLKEISFNIQKGEFFGLIGPSGAGKSTILKMLLGIYKITDGILDINTEKIKNFGFASQENSFYEKLTVKENLELFGQLFNVNKEILKERIKTILLLVNLEEAEDTIAEKLSGGMKRRLDLACSLVHDPEILILDEPTSNLDPLLKREILKLIKKIHAKGKTIIMSSHALEEIEDLCTNIALINKGKIVKTGSPKHLRNFYSRTDEIVLETFPGNYKTISSYLYSIPGIDYVRLENNKLKFNLSQTNQNLQAILALLTSLNEKVVEFQVNKLHFNEVFDILVKQDYYKKYGKAFINTYIKQGYTKEQIKQHLLEKGWPTNIISELIQ